MVVQGVITAEDADLACQHGVDGILVSNHGARQLDTVPATIEALPEVVAAVKGRCEVREKKGGLGGPQHARSRKIKRELLDRKCLKGQKRLK